MCHLSLQLQEIGMANSIYGYLCRENFNKFARTMGNCARTQTQYIHVCHGLCSMVSHLRVLPGHDKTYVTYGLGYEWLIF